MIKQASITAISFYQIFISVLIKNLLGVQAACRFDETCSAYTKRAIIEKGVFKGLYQGFVRILRCQPFSS